MANIFSLGGKRKLEDFPRFFWAPKKSCVFSKGFNVWKSHYCWNFPGRPRHKSQWLQKWIQHLRLSVMTRITTFRLNFGTLKIESNDINMFHKKTTIITIVYNDNYYH